MPNKFYGATALIGGTTGALDNIDESVISDGDGGYVITDAERIYIFHYDSSDVAVEDSPRIIVPDDISRPTAGSFLIAEAVVKNVLMATNNAYLKGTDTGDNEVNLIGINASDDTIITAIAGQSVDVTITGTGKIADFAAAGLTLAAGATVGEFSTDGTLAGNSDTAVPTEKAVKTYVDTAGAGYATLAGVETFTNKTLTSPVLNGSLSGTAFLDENNMASDSEVAVASQQSIKAYVDTHAADTSTHGVTTVAGLAEAQTFTNKTLTSPVLNTGLSGTAFLDENDMASDSDTKVASQQSIKAYVASGTVTMTNKTLTSPVLNTGVSGTAVLDEDNMASNSATQLATQQSIKAYVDSGTVTMTNKTLTSPIINTILAKAGETGIAIGADGGVDLYYDNVKEAETESGYLKATNAFNIAGDGATVTGIKDEDTMSSNSAVKLATQQSIKAYVDNKSYRNSYGSAATWNVAHNLGIQNCNVEVIVGGVSVAGTYDEPTITFTDANNLTVGFTAATAGDVVVYS